MSSYNQSRGNKRDSSIDESEYQQVEETNHTVSRGSLHNQRPVTLIEKYAFDPSSAYSQNHIELVQEVKPFGWDIGLHK